MSRQYNVFDLPRKGDPLYLEPFLTEVRSLLDECFRQTIAGPSSIPIHLAFGIEGYVPRSLREIGDICNTPHEQRLRRLEDEHSYLIRMHIKVKAKYVLQYYVPNWLRGFFFDPNRSQYLYSTSLVIDKCHWSLATFEMQRARFLLRSFPVGSFQRLAEIFHGPANWALLKINIVSGACHEMFLKCYWTSVILRCYLRSSQC